MKYIKLSAFVVSLAFITPCFAATETAIFAGGCFWSMQHDFENVPGIINTTVGYTGGDLANPSYQQVSKGDTDHYESIKIEYDPNQISYEKLLDLYFHDTDPTNADGQFCDTGTEYRPVIFYLNNKQKTLAENMKSGLEKTKFSSVATQILPAKTFYSAESYHQHYADKNPYDYAEYREGCRRDETLKTVWEK